MTTTALHPGGLSPRLWWAAAGASGAGALAWIATHDPHEAGHYPGCFLLATTGLYCPACGGTRATYDLLHGDLAGAFARHPLVPVLVVVAAALLALRLVRRWRPSLPAPAYPVWFPVAIALVALVFGVLRNVPGWTWLSPA
ncbi:DUF2752 domain-containing protein [Phycicoccus sp. CSK15P-2]|uniref:DUF2752 domain-containing protein n=1 Tax=Phycicoccus sp. CSK15P-2 TaxID=2807627 RepID=UPI0027DDC0FA|nr:DUF2752 domain-containing protein [Phycicoccus sp. CSK15P-2]